MLIFKDVKWSGYFPFDQLRKMIHQLKPSDIKDDKQNIFLSQELKLHIQSIGYVYSFIGFILKRLDDEISKTLKEDIPSQTYYINIDVYSFILFSHILLDKIPYLVDYLVWGSTKPKIKSFTDFKKDIVECRGENIDELIRIINRTDWYLQLDFIRDKAVVHKGREMASLFQTYDDLGIHFG